MSVDIGKLCDELNEKCFKLEKELELYRQRVCPMYICGQKLFCIDPKKREIVEMTVQEIVISSLGVMYREYIDENTMKQFSELFCFTDTITANEALKNYVSALKE